MIIGIHSRDNDLVVNPIKGKQLTNVRASGTDEAVRLVPPIQMSLEYAVEFIDDDELVEITPKSIRLRKRYLQEHERRRASRENAYTNVPAAFRRRCQRKGCGRGGHNLSHAAAAIAGGQPGDRVGRHVRHGGKVGAPVVVDIDAQRQALPPQRFQGAPQRGVGFAVQAAGLRADAGLHDGIAVTREYRAQVAEGQVVEPGHEHIGVVAQARGGGRVRRHCQAPHPGMCPRRERPSRSRRPSRCEAEVVAQAADVREPGALELAAILAAQVLAVGQAVDWPGARCPSSRMRARNEGDALVVRQRGVAGRAIAIAAHQDQFGSGPGARARQTAGTAATRPASRHAGRSASWEQPSHAARRNGEDFCAREQAVDLRIGPNVGFDPQRCRPVCRMAGDDARDVFVEVAARLAVALHGAGNAQRLRRGLSFGWKRAHTKGVEPVCSWPMW